MQALLRLFKYLMPGIVLISLVAACDRFEAFIAPNSALWPRWQAHDSASTRNIDHSKWGGFLDANLGTGADGIARIAYGRVGGAHRILLKAYVQGLADLPISTYGRRAQRAYWVNLYNAVTVDLILSRYPVGSILDINISPGLLAFGPWDKKLIEVEGEMLSLNDIEHRILRPIWRDPRLHYVLNCASVGCPNLPPRPLTAANGEQLLHEAARSYINHPRGARVRDGEVVISKIYNWFSTDFGEDDRAILSHIRRYALPPLARLLDGVSGIGGYEYDWALNDSRRK